YLHTQTHRHPNGATPSSLSEANQHHVVNNKPQQTSKPRRLEDAIPRTLLFNSAYTSPPNAAQLHHATTIFQNHTPSIIASTSSFHSLPITGLPEVAFIGRSNVGKSSLLNSLLNTSILHTSKNPGRTRTMNVIACGGPNGQGQSGKINVLDMPGYGFGSRREWGEQIGRYLQKRRELKRVFVVVDAKLGLKSSDEVMLGQLRDMGVMHQIVLSKVDFVLGLEKGKVPGTEKVERKAMELGSLVEAMRGVIRPERSRYEGMGAVEEVLACSTRVKGRGGVGLGVDNLRWVVLQATGLSWEGSKLRKEDVVVSLPKEMGQVEVSGP
ncbi:hypothetical protein MMC25_008334, partial [Agyrium rufum]|nr:hypothetical protein [Agyrium rufum]